MKPFARIMLLTLGFALLSASIGVFTTPSGRAAAANLFQVFVTNTASTPVPVTGSVGVSGTPNVNVTNTPAVNAQQVTGGTLNFSNTPSTPIFTRDKDNPALAPFQTTLCIGLSLATCAGLPNIFTVGASQQLVIEFVAVRCRPNGGAVALSFLTTTAGGNSAAYRFPPGQAGSSGTEFIANQQVRIYADPGTNVELSSFDSFGSGAFCTATLSGNLVTP